MGGLRFSSVNRGHEVTAEDFVRREVALLRRWALHRFAHAVSVLVDSVAAGQAPEPEPELELESEAAAG